MNIESFAAEVRRRCKECPTAQFVVVSETGRTWLVRELESTSEGVNMHVTNDECAYSSEREATVTIDFFRDYANVAGFQIDVTEDLSKFDQVSSD